MSGLRTYSLRGWPLVPFGKMKTMRNTLLEG